ncbi:MAG: DUF938 domain-containing protein [Candidatus Eremiobacteraeota bacterium]|nr:DUF938 domain-containing protein [Candidatus Eremiobacteraeota bacterium]
MPVRKKSSTATFTDRADIITKEARLHFPATAQNHAAIWEVLGPLAVAAKGPVLEVASGSGEHLARFSALSPRVHWQGSDPDPGHRASILAYNPGLPEPLDLDVSADWTTSVRWSGIVAINLLHIAPWEATTGLLRGAAAQLSADGWLYLYGAYFFRDRVNAPSNLAFDQGLRSQNPAWGVRWLEEVVKEAELQNLALERVVDMPANNFSLIFRRLAV